MSKKKNDVVIIDDVGFLSSKEDDCLLPVDDAEVSEALITPTTTPEVDEESPQPLDTAKEFAEKTEH